MNKFSFKTKETGEFIDAATCSPDGSALYVKTSGDGFSGFYKFTNDKDTEPLYMQKITDRSTSNDADNLFSSDDGNSVNGIQYENAVGDFIDAREYYELYREQGFHEFVLPAYIKVF